MKITDIDPDFIDIINELNNAGFKTFSSCDGVLANHIERFQSTQAYISFLKSPRIIELMTAFLRDSDFTVSFSTQDSTVPSEYLGNLLEGNTYSVYFQNLHGERTDYVKKIIRGIIDKSITIPENEQSKLVTLDETLSNSDENSRILLSVDINTEAESFMSRKNDKFICLTANGKNINSHSYYSFDVDAFAKRICDKFNIPMENFEECLSDRETHQYPEFVINILDTTYIYLPVDSLDKVNEIIGYIRSIEPTIDFDMIEDEFSLEDEER